MLQIIIQTDNQLKAQELKQQLITDCRNSEQFKNLQESIESGRSIFMPKKEYDELLEKTEKYVNLIESFTFDFNPIDNIEEVARQFIDNEIRTTHKLYEENKQLKEKIELQGEKINQLRRQLNATKEGENE